MDRNLAVKSDCWSSNLQEKRGYIRTMFGPSSQKKEKRKKEKIKRCLYVSQGNLCIGQTREGQVNTHEGFVKSCDACLQAITVGTARAYKSVSTASCETPTEFSKNLLIKKERLIRSHYITWSQDTKWVNAISRTPAYNTHGKQGFVSWSSFAAPPRSQRPSLQSLKIR